ncbi:MAG: threonine--tRNA ligase [Candidatus Taylorbacteria bacterium]|nr:threonine--tRNA ligase [Candidatus Taylorbacteria bacterium]
MNTHEELPQIRHSLAHLLAAAVQELHPGTKNTIGPAIDDGFYYDFEFMSPISDKELPALEKKMRSLLPTWKEFTHKEISEKEAREYFKDNPYKLELIEEITKKGEKITLYTSGTFTDLCRGGHVGCPAKDIRADAFRLTRIAGAYWRGDEKNTMLTRIYGHAFETKERLDDYETMQEEAKKRDHKKLGRELGLFTISPLVGAGLPLMQPKGMVIRKAVEDYLWELHKVRGYQRVWTPHIAKEELYITSGHAAKFGDELFRVQGKDEKFIMKPMNCPHHMQIFADNQFSYRHMPVRYFEPATVYRDEKTGQLGGLTRVRSITQDDGHLFCRVSQINQEVSAIVDIIRNFYTTIGLMNDYWVSLSVRGDDKSKYLGTDEAWETAEAALEQAAKDNKLNYKRVTGEAAFYGPKLDFMFKDAIGREWQLGTIQCDFNLPERFDLSFINEKGEKERPVVIHRAISGSLERFLGIIIEHFVGKFPLWLSPVQTRIIPIGEAHHAEAIRIHDMLSALDIRSEIDLSHDNFGKKVRAAKTEHIPYFIIIGDKDIAAGKITLESRDKGQIGQISPEELVAKLTQEIKTRAL